ncbi:MAG TPA: 8-amino-7-oxononanoate synthase, partial [Nevskiaceae bacterium]|nr:8-amino-7-oxononanoate synthase [Nevskiaceae bacterium]
ELAQFCGRERALLFSTGWAANLGVLRALLGKADTLIADELNHASLIDGGKLSGARYVRVAHADADAYARELAQAQGLRLVATDSVFSMDGDIAPLEELSALCRERDAALMVDDAHGFGVTGARGRGACVAPPDIYVATLGKSIGCAGAFVAGDEALIEYLIQRARSWIFSTAPPPALAAAARRALAIVNSDEGEELRARLHARVGEFRDGCAQRGIALGVGGIGSASAIQPLVLGEETRALALSKFLYERGLWVAAIRPPTVPRGTARLRITLSAAHGPAEVQRLLDLLAEGVKMLPPHPAS